MIIVLRRGCQGEGVKNLNYSFKERVSQNVLQMSKKNVVKERVSKILIIVLRRGSQKF